MKNLFKNRYAFIIVGNHDTGKSTMMKKLLDMELVKYTANARLNLCHTDKIVNLANCHDWEANIVCCSHSFYGEHNDDNKVASLENDLKKPQSQFALFPEWENYLTRLVNTLSQNNYLVTCYHIYFDENVIRNITINHEDFKLGDVTSDQYKDNLKRIKEDMYRVIMPI